MRLSVCIRGYKVCRRLSLVFYEKWIALHKKPHKGNPSECKGVGNYKNILHIMWNWASYWTLIIWLAIYGDTFCEYTNVLAKSVHHLCSCKFSFVIRNILERCKYQPGLQNSIYSHYVCTTDRYENWIRVPSWWYDGCHCHIEFFLPFKFLEEKKHILLGADAESESLRLSYWCPGLRVKCAMAAETASIGCQGRGVRRALPTFRRAASSRWTNPPGVWLHGCARCNYSADNCHLIAWFYFF